MKAGLNELLGPSSIARKQGIPRGKHSSLYKEIEWGKRVFDRKSFKETLRLYVEAAYALGPLWPWTAG